MLAYRLSLRVAAILIALIGATAHAGEGHRSHFGGDVRQSETVIGGNGLPSVIPGIGTFTGSISALRIKGNGVFIAIDRRSGPTSHRYQAPKARIIEISAENPEEACSFEAGVCVIRPKN